MGRQFRPAVVLLLAFTVLTGIGYPLAVTGIARLLFPDQAGGSLLVKGGRPVGSALIGQPFDDPKYFWSRPSATLPFPYKASASAGSNPTNPAPGAAVAARVAALRATDPGNTAPVPVDLVTASASGLDPHISPAAALYQVPRVAKTRGMEEAGVRALVLTHTVGRQLGVLASRGSMSSD